jgi:protocatechuate 3,4-dioxygenase beta subunit
MTRKNVWLVALLAVTGAGAVWLLNPSAGEEGAAATPGGSWADEPDFGPASALSAARPDEANLARTAVPADPAPETDDEEDGPRPALTVSGRVINDGGVPVADARVAVNYRLSFEGMRGRDFGGGERGRALRRRPVAESVRTDREGRFTLQGRAFAASTLDVVVAHKDYAPATVQREWQRRDGIVELGDITVATGALVSGFVVDKNGQGIEGAEVRVLPNEQGPFGGGRGGRGRGGRGGNEDEGDAGSLVAAVKTDRAGFFHMEHVPEGRFRLQARAARYLPALTETLQAKSATTVDAGQLQLVLGVQLRGVVVDPSGAPIADARVEAGAARGEARPGDNEQGREPGRQRQANGAEQQPDWQALAAAWRAGGNDRRTRTDKRGEFVLDSLPPTALRLRVEHPRFISEERQPIEANKEPRVTVRLEPALAITGRVVDAATGEPIEVFAIAAREAEDWGTRDFGFGNRGGGNESGRGRRGGDGEGRRRGGNAEGDDPSNDELAAMRAAEEARRAQRTAYLQDRLGPTGQVPRNPGRADKHAGGHFTLPGLQPGRYVVDVMADDYVGIASGPIELVKGQAAGEMTISLRRGSRIAGRVEDKVTGLPLAGVAVELQLPDLEAAPPSNDGPWTAFRREAGRVRVARARTDSTGRFVLRPQRSGDYWLALEHDGYNTFVDRAVFVPAAQPLETPAYALVPSSCVFGQVRNPQPGKQYTLSFWSTSGQRVTARTDKDFRYRVESIEPGSYYALLSDGAGGGEPGGRGGRGGPLGSMGTRLAEFARGNTQPDVVIGEGAQVQFDFDARAQAPATVKGKVLLNGNAASGYDVALAAREENSTGNNGNGFPSRMLGRLLSARTDEQGEFTIPNVPAGQYTLELRRGGGGPGGRGGRGGGGGGATVHREPIFVTQGATVERTLMFAIGSLAFEVVTDPEAKPIERGNVQLVLRTEAATVAPDQWRTLPSFTNAQVRTGAASVRELKLGEWTYRVQAQGQQTLEGVVFVDATPTPAPVKVKLKPATAAPAPNGTSAGTGNR